MNLALLGLRGDAMIEFVNTALGLIGAGLAGALLMSSIRESARAWRWIASGILLFAGAEAMQGLFFLLQLSSESESTLWTSVLHDSIQLISIALVLVGVLLEARLRVSDVDDEDGVGR